MEKINAEKLIERIEEAKDWLEKAKDEYSKSNPVRGGLILNLAQAEVKHAWELSHHQIVSQNIGQHIGQPLRTRNNKILIPVAACLVLFVGVFAGVRYSSTLLSKTGKVKPIHLTSVKAGQPKHTTTVATNRAQLDPVLPEPQTGHTTLTVVQPESMPDVKTGTVAKHDTALSRNTNSLAVHNEVEVPQNKPTLKAVTQLSIDEEALTKEASHSLRIGK